MRRIVVGITGASGALYGIRALEMLARISDIETHLVLTKGAKATIAMETDWHMTDVAALADVTHSNADLAAPIASGSFDIEAMLVAPCSIKTLSGIANCYSDNLVLRTADVTLKERRRLLLLVRETPLHAGHIRLLAEVTASGAVVMPPVPSFYTRPATLDDVVDQTTARALDVLGIESSALRRWSGPSPRRATSTDVNHRHEESRQ